MMTIPKQEAHVQSASNLMALVGNGTDSMLTNPRMMLDEGVQSVSQSEASRKGPL